MAKLEKGLLIAIEGIDGAGKTTQAHLLEQRLVGLGYEVLYTKEPTNGKWGQMIRQSKVEGRLNPDEEYGAFINDRREHVADVIEPQLADGTIVIVDRYYFSTIAYQGATGIKEWKTIQAENEAFAPRPDLLVILEMEPAESIKRICERDEKPDSFESVENLSDCRDIFDQIEGDFVMRIDGRKSIDAINQEILTKIRDSLLFSRLCAKGKSNDDHCTAPNCVLMEGCPYFGFLPAASSPERTEIEG